ncbi:MAG: hypothetical protein MI864_01975 [Pseudomonadales bacterium]|nr:hypothetical protein [Pseudomonadales bacterium]
MGNGHYTNEAYIALRTRKSYSSKTREQIFESRQLDTEMDPRRIQIRESRDSTEHPESLAIIIGLDVTGSMGFVPEDIVKNTLPDLMGSLIQAGVEHPQVLFLGLGDFVYDRAPLQVGQFESSAELLDRWLTRVYLEQGGGGNNGESYNLAYLFAARHTSIDCFEKRQQKGYVFTIGDEPCLGDIPGDVIRRLTPEDQARTVSTAEILQEAQAQYQVYHLHLLHNQASQSEHRKAGWRDLLGQQFIEIEDYRTVAKRIAECVIRDLETQNRCIKSTDQKLTPNGEEIIL